MKFKFIDGQNEYIFEFININGYNFMRIGWHNGFLFAGFNFNIINNELDYPNFGNACFILTDNARNHINRIIKLKTFL